MQKNKSSNKITLRNCENFVFIIKLNAKISFEKYFRLIKKKHMKV